MKPRKNYDVLLRGLLVAMLLTVFSIHALNILREFEALKPPTNRELIALGRPTLHHAEFIATISRDLNVQKGVELILGPPLSGRGRLTKSPLTYYILIEERFFLSLTDTEQKALIAHEMGHIFFMPPNCTDYMSCQIGSDLVAALYTSPQAVIDLLGKLSNAPDWRESPDYKVRVPELEKLKGEPLLSKENLLLLQRP